VPSFIRTRIRPEITTAVWASSQERVPGADPGRWRHDRGVPSLTATTESMVSIA
jgi:hypothetical protein